jgi:hypothetical protein
VTVHAFVDESHRGSYLLVVSILTPSDLSAARTLMRSLLLPGERRVHFQSERDGRRREVLGRLVDAELRTKIYESVGKPDAARPAALLQLTEDLVKLDARRLVLESRGQAADRRDRQVIARVVGPRPELAYEHLRPHEEPLLWIPDAVAWSYGAGGEWRRRARPLVDDVVSVRP